MEDEFKKLAADETAADKMRDEFNNHFNQADQNNDERLNQEEWIEFNQIVHQANQQKFKEAVPFDKQFFVRYYDQLNKLDASKEGITKEDFVKNSIIF